MNKQTKALLTFTCSQETRKWLLENDPKALEQAEKAINAAYEIRHREGLLQNIASGLSRFQENKIYNLQVRFLEDGKTVLKADVPTALDYLANDIYWNEESDWSNANIAVVEIL
jgi:hypothetical protein